MTIFALGINPDTVRVLALALLHFLWQGAALAALAYVAMALCRSASARYVAGVSAMALMLVAPVGTFFVLQSPAGPDSPTQATEAISSAVLPGSTSPIVAAQHAVAGPSGAPAYLLWLVEGWFAGVIVLSLRSAGGFLLVERLRRAESTPVSEPILDLCRNLQQRMGLARAVRYCQSLHLDAPAVAGWARPAVLLPVTALTGLDQSQLEAVIAHELAHIRRYDAFVNLFQVAVETVLFYHPAVWWLGRRIRAERENCCDDEAVALCGSPVMYALALARMAEWKSAPELAMAANRAPLVERVARLLGADRTADSLGSAKISAGVLCLSAALLAGGAVSVNVLRAQAQTPAPAAAPNAVERATPPARPAPMAAAPDTAIVVRPSDPEAESAAAPEAPSRFPGATAAAPSAPFASSGTPAPEPTPQAVASSTTPKQSYIDSLKEAGLTNLSVDELIGLKVQGVTAEYVKAMKELGIKPDVDELIGMKVQGITPQYVKEMRAATGQNLDTDALIGLKVQGVTPEYNQQMRDLGFKLDADQVIGLKVQGITPEYVRKMKELGLKIDSDDIIGMKVQGITPEYVKSFQDMGIHPDTEELIGMKVQGITAAYIKELQSAGFKVDIEEAIGAKVQGITPEFIAKARSHGFKDLTLEKLIALKQTGVLDEEK